MVGEKAAVSVAEGGPYALNSQYKAKPHIDMPAALQKAGDNAGCRHAEQSRTYTIKQLHWYDAPRAVP